MGTTITILASLIVIAGLTWGKKLTLDYEKRRPFECGFTPKFNARLPFTLRFFLIAIIFLVFDVELILIFPLMATRVVANYIIYFLLVILILGLSHEWNQGSLEWALRETHVADELGVNTLQRHLLVDRLLWARDTVTVSLAVLVMVGVILGLSHDDRNELLDNRNRTQKWDESH